MPDQLVSEIPEQHIVRHRLFHGAAQTKVPRSSPGCSTTAQVGTAWAEGLAAGDPSHSASHFLAVRVTAKLKFTYKCPKVARDTVPTKILSPFQHSFQGENN